MQKNKTSQVGKERNQFKLMKDVDCYLSSVAYDTYLKPRHRPDQNRNSIVFQSGRSAKDSARCMCLLLPDSKFGVRQHSHLNILLLIILVIMCYLTQTP